MSYQVARVTFNCILSAVHEASYKSLHVLSLPTYHHDPSPRSSKRGLYKLCVLRSFDQIRPIRVSSSPPAAEAWTFAISMNLIMRSRPLGVLVQHDSSFWNAITGALQSIPAALPSWITCQALLLTTSVLIEGAHSKKRGQWLVPCR